MLWKNGKRNIGFCVRVVTVCFILVIILAVLVTHKTVLAAKPEPGENPGGNIVQQDIPGELTLTGSDLKGDTTSQTYSDSEAGTTCFIGRRRGIWVSISKNSPRTMNLTLGAVIATSFNIPDGDELIEPGDDPWGVDTGVTPPGLPAGPIYQVDLGIAPSLNVSGLDDGASLEASTKLIFLDSDSTGDQWDLYFGRGRTTEDGWGGARFFTELNAEPVIVNCVTKNESWTVTSNNTPGYLWYRGSKNNAPWVYVGTYNVLWSCNVVYIP